MRTIPIAEINSGVAWLESTPREGHEPIRAELAQLPFTIGRNESCDLTIESNRISREHVRIELTDGNFAVRDLGSTNGTFVNGVKIQESPLNDGDLLTVANVGLIVHLPRENARIESTLRFTTHCEALPDSQRESPFQLIETVRALQELALHRGARNRLQAIVRMDDSEALGYEFTGNGITRHDPELPTGPDCRALRRANDLGRTLAVEQAWSVFGDVRMFLPASLSELKSAELLDSLDRLKQRPTGEAHLVLQVPPEAIANAGEFCELCGQLREIGVEVAIDRFAGTPAELGALSGQPPAYVKLAPSVVQSLGRSLEQRRKLQSLLQSAHDMAIQVVGCGVDSEEAWLACKGIGMPLAQGDFAAASMLLDACGTQKR